MFWPKNEMNNNQLVLYVSYWNLTYVSIQNKTWSLAILYLQFQDCRLFHAPSNTDSIWCHINWIKCFISKDQLYGPFFFLWYCTCILISWYFKVICCTQLHILLFCDFTSLFRMKRSLNRYMYGFCWKMSCVPWMQISYVYCVEKISFLDSCINKAKNITKKDVCNLSVDT